MTEIKLVIIVFPFKHRISCGATHTHTHIKWTDGTPKHWYFLLIQFVNSVAHPFVEQTIIYELFAVILLCCVLVIERSFTPRRPLTDHQTL